MTKQTAKKTATIEEAQRATAFDLAERAFLRPDEVRGKAPDRSILSAFGVETMEEVVTICEREHRSARARFSRKFPELPPQKVEELFDEAFEVSQYATALYGQGVTVEQLSERLKSRFPGYSVRKCNKIAADTFIVMR